LSIKELQPDFRHTDSYQEHLAARKKRLYIRRQLNIPLLLCSIAGVAIFLGAGKYWHEHKKLQLADVFLQRAEDLESQEKWPQAMAYLQRYLWIKPDDLDKRLQIIDLFEKGLQTPRDRSRLSTMLYEMLGLVPQRLDLRLRLAENLLALRDYSRAEGEARTVEESAQEGSTQQARAKRLIALSLFPRARASAGLHNRNANPVLSGTEKDQWARQAKGVSIGLAAQALADALEDFPGDVELAAVTAEFYRKYQSTLNSESLDAAKYADGVMERLLQKRSENPDALVSVYLYRTRYKLPEAQSQLTQSLQLAPNHHQALLLSAAEAVRQADSHQEALDAASGNLQKAIDAQPKDHRAYVLIARLLARTGDLDGSIKILQEGKQQVGASNIALGQELTSMLFEAKKIPPKRKPFWRS